MKTATALILLIAGILMSGCATRRQAPPTAQSGPTTLSAPQEPLLNLAWKSAQQIRAGLEDLGLPGELRLAPIENGAGIPPEAVRYFQEVLVTRLSGFGVRMPGDAGVQLDGALYFLRDQLVFGVKFRSGETVLYSDTAAVPRDVRLQNTLAQFSPQMPHQHPEHAEVEIPTPVARLEEPPLDVTQMCGDHRDSCDLLLLYSDHVEILDWKTLIRRIVKIPPRFLASMRSRAPSGRIVRSGNFYIVVSNSLDAPLVFDADFNGPVSGVPVPVPVLPAASPGLNTYVLGDGRFYDFEALRPSGLAVIDATRHLGVALEGELYSSEDIVGTTLAARWPVLYTSAAVLPGDPDSVRKFQYGNGSVLFVVSRPAVGEILDLAVTDLNQDGKDELLVTTRRSEGIFVEVWEAF